MAFLLVCGMLLGVCMTSEAAIPKISSTILVLTAGETVKLSVKNAGDTTITWKSSNKKVATVSSKGKVKAKKAGTAEITAEVGAKKLTCKLKVMKNAPVLSDTEMNLLVGQTNTLSVMNAGKKKIKWSSSKKSVATVTSKGKVKGKKAGTAKITAKVGKNKLICIVTVEEEPDQAIAQSAMQKTATEVTVYTGNKSWGVFLPKVRLTNPGSEWINVFRTNTLNPWGITRLWLRGKQSVTRLLDPNRTYTYSFAESWGGRPTRGTVKAERGIISIR